MTDVAKRKIKHFSIRLTPELQKRIHEYIMKVAHRKGEIPFGIKSRIGEMALEEWLDNHEEDVDLF